MKSTNVKLVSTTELQKSKSLKILKRPESAANLVVNPLKKLEKPASQIKIKRPTSAVLSGKASARDSITYARQVIPISAIKQIAPPSLK